MAGLLAREITVRYPGAADTVVALDRVSIGIDQEIVAVLGPSGCGKSTMLRAIAGLEPIESGQVSYDGVDQVRIPVHRRGFGLMFQDGQLFEHLSVAANVGYGLRRAGVARGAAAVRARELLELVGLGGYDDRAPSTLSGGERQRVALARSLAPSPKLILLDEPLSALDRSLRTRLGLDVRRILTSTQTDALLVTHDHEEAFTVADRVAIMRAGRIVQVGTPAAVWAAPVDGETALFLGFDSVLEADQGAELRALVEVSGAIALRANALRVTHDGPLAAEVLSAVPALDELRLRVRLRDGLEVGAVAPLNADVRPTRMVRLGVDHVAIAPLPDSP